MGKIRLPLWLFFLGLYLILGQVVSAWAQLPPEFPPALPEAQTPLSLEEILPRKAPAERVMQEDEEAGDQKSTTNAAMRKAHELDKLFWQLKRTVDADEAVNISRQIQGLWAQSGSDTVDLLMQWAENAIAETDYAQALDFLDNVVMLKSDFAEGWMRRASVHIQRHDLALAMLDLSQVLAIEPRHYQAMSQLGLIMEMTERKSAALTVYAQALAVYPQFTRLQKRLDNLLDEVTEQSL